MGSGGRRQVLRKSVKGLRAPRRMCDIEKIEKVQMRATKLIRSLSSRSYVERLRALELPALRYRQLRGDLIQLHRYVNNKYDTNFVLQLHYKSVLDKRYDTRGHRYKLVPQLCKSIILAVDWRSLHKHSENY